jgi:hypothetical protein
VGGLEVYGCMWFEGLWGVWKRERFMGCGVSWRFIVCECGVEVIVFCMGG